ncbi:unnamed protein product [Staurois parvus]|uniref:Pentraxin (PTX) domain-containing protein n=1 Tax=Staurois parvus TaxID=386267 RepID=A0ABN9GSF3_9NEOB|nr:unnamed protein product [Staurois parvus]
MFVFPKETDTAHVILRPTITRPLQQVSVCLRTFSELSRWYPLFSLATPTYKDAFLIRFQAPTNYMVYIGHASSVLKRDSEPPDWSHTCVTWALETGVVHLWSNEKISTKIFNMRGISIATETSVVLGQEQGSYGGGFDASRSLVGEISDVHMWDYVLTQQDIQKVLSGDLHGNVINWKSLVYEMKGDVLLQPTNLCKSVIYTLIIKFHRRAHRVSAGKLERSPYYQLCHKRSDCALLFQCSNSEINVPYICIHTRVC